jgi:hypothetical protein
MIYCSQVIGILTETGETEALAVLNCLDIARLNEVMAIFMRFIKCMKGNFLSYFNIFPRLQKLMANIGSLRADQHAAILMQTVSERFSRTTDLDCIFAYCLVTPVGKRYCGAVQRASAFTASIEVMWRQGIDALPKAFSDNMGQMVNLFHNHFDSPR